MCCGGKLHFYKARQAVGEDALPTRLSLYCIGGKPEEEEKASDVGEGGEEDTGGQSGVDAHPSERQRDHDAG